jgi:peptide/nickel transport system substrate-binding protein
MWTRVGLRTEVQTFPWTTYAARNARQEFNARLVGWGSVTGEASYMLVNIFGTFDREKRRGAANSSRYSNPALDALTERAAATLDDAEREKLLREAVKMVTTDEQVMIPLFQLVNVWAARRGFVYTPRMDERTTAMAVKPAN